ncbi:MAG: hypothetical protein KAI22_08500 [Gammaproteobacteria bacterium]|nr:hypothetical protein [Gammaproteobacteria bacterium]
MDSHLIPCSMAYVDLNPIRADLCDSLDSSEYTSVKQRIDEIVNKSPEVIVPLAPFIASSQTDTGIPFSLADYLELTDWTGRCVRPDKRGTIPQGTPKILHQLGLDEDAWMETVKGFSSEFHCFVGPEDKLQTLCQKQAKKWIRGIQLCRKLFTHKALCPI